MRKKPDDPLWYKDAVVYEVPVAAFLDGNGDGHGDFVGLSSKLDYVTDLGATCVALPPFVRSSGRDLGYDVTSHTDIDPRHGTLDEFVGFVRAAHARGVRVLVDFPLSHTSSAHPWFQRARVAPRGSAERDYYVWSDTGDEDPDVPVIPCDSETSNWTWDEEARAFYWHRLRSFEPALDPWNPAVLDALVEAMRFWLGHGVDGLRLHGVSLVRPRAGGVPPDGPREPHDLLREIRRRLERTHPGRVLVALADEPPEEAARYFGEKGDGCHVTTHSALTARVFEALRLEDAFPLIDTLLRSTPPDDRSQWGLFLRCGEELSLRSLSPDERDYMYLAYCQDPRMKWNVGIRRRLSPLLRYSRPMTELAHALLLTLPGTPTLYYGDELGMGDDVSLEDRRGLRTPMQWSADRNAGFSPADPQQLPCPVVSDPVHGFAAVNVDAQLRNPSSLLNRLRILVALRQLFKLFGRGSLRVLESSNRKVFGYVREHGEEAVLCVANFSRYTQATDLDVRGYARPTIPVEMEGYTEFPLLDEDRYRVVLGPYGFQWLELRPLPPDDPRSWEYRSCFISYAGGDMDFANRLHADLSKRNVRCWFAPQAMQSGRKVHAQLEEAIAAYDRVLLILSPHSMASEWVKAEIAAVTRREAREHAKLLVPIRLVDLEAIGAWECVDPATGRDSAVDIREYFIPDFSGWNDAARYGRALEALLRGLRTGKRRVAGDGQAGSQPR